MRAFAARIDVRVLAVWWAACLLWSSTFLLIRIGLASIPPFTFAWLRLALALAVLLPLTIVRGDARRLQRTDIVHIATAGVLLLGVNYALVFWGAQFIPSGLVAILQSVQPLAGLALGWALGSERVTLRKFAAVTMAMGGVMLIFGAEAYARGRPALAGSIAVFTGSLCVASAYVWMKTYSAIRDPPSAVRVSPLAVTTVQSLAGVVPLALCALIVEGHPRMTGWPMSAWGALLYLALGASVLALWLNYWLLQRMDASAMLMMGVAEVPIAIALGAVVLDERLPAGTLAGAICVLAAVVTILAPAPPVNHETHQSHET